ncbi:hypothetical protein B0H19DRAFT_1133912 [Mycena capillaripes]|nr:hypothetical protein B0H19DRAFT_1133912 [Mycena capillaripes]
MADADIPLKAQVAADTGPDDGPGTPMDTTAGAPAAVEPHDVSVAAEDAVPPNMQKQGEDDVVSAGENEQDRVVGAISEQSASLKTMFERLTVAVETLKQQPKSTDKKTAFWTEYKTLADEFDKDFQNKYGNDLDTSLIFAGLFSAISSAFIIFIQPEFQPDPNATIQALLVLLVQNVTAVPVNLMPQNTGPPRIVVVAQGLLYFSLLSTLLAALLAVLGKQWLLYYDSVGGRGTIEERGLERQRKFDGLRRWKFHLVMQMFPLLLQFALLLFATALSIYLWTIHPVIAVIVLALTCLGFTGYAAMTIAALIWRDSPFQTSLGFVLKTIVKGPSHPYAQSQVWAYSRRISLFFSQVWSACVRAQTALKPLLPIFNLTRARHIPTPIFHPSSQSQPSEEISAVIWALETSTSPDMVGSAADMVPELRWWPVKFDVQPALKRLYEVHESCKVGYTVQEGMIDRATACMKAFAVLELVTEQHQRTPDSWGYSPLSLSNSPNANEEELKSLVKFFRIFRTTEPLEAWELAVAEKPWVMTQWILRFIGTRQCPEMHLRTVLTCFHAPKEYAPPILADFLFCLNSFFSPTMACDRSVLYKNEYEVLLITLLFENLNKRLADKTPLDQEIAHDIVIRVAEIADQTNTHPHRQVDTRCINAAYRFCAAHDVSQEAITSAVRLVRLDSLYLDSRLSMIKADTVDVEWVYRALESLNNSEPRPDIVADLLQALLFCGPIRGKPSASTLHTILSALSSDTFAEPSEGLKCTASAVLLAADHWFDDNELGPILADDSVWRNLGGLVTNAYHYTILGERLSSIPQWTNIISQDLPGWILQYGSLMIVGSSFQIDEQRAKFLLVLSRVWGKELEVAPSEEPLAVVFAALANAWDQVDLSGPQVLEEVHGLRLLRSTISMMLCSRKLGFDLLQHPSQHFRDTSMDRLGDALGRAAVRANPEAVSNENLEAAVKGGLQEVGKLLTKLALTINGELRNPPQFENEAAEVAHWMRLERTLWEDFWALRTKATEVTGGEVPERVVNSS